MVLMGISGGLEGLETENVEKPLVLPLLFEEHLKGATTKTLFWGEAVWVLFRSKS